MSGACRLSQASDEMLLTAVSNSNKCRSTLLTLSFTAFPQPIPVGGLVLMKRQSAACMCRAGLPKWCGAFKACDTKNVAVVGNGPLSAQQRSELKGGRFQVIVRFNYLNNRYKSITMDVLCTTCAHGCSASILCTELH